MNEKTEPFVSVIIATYNRYKYLLNAIQSVKTQKYSNIEIIVVNDNSTEKEYYTHDWENEKVTMIHLNRNSNDLFGFPCAGYVRNQGIAVAKGKYIAFIDDDDIWFDNKISLQITSMISSGCKMSSTDGLIGHGVYDKTKKYKMFNKENYFDTIQKKYRNNGSNMMDNGYPKFWTYEFLKIHNCMICSSVIVEKEVLSKIGNFKEVPNGQEDYSCWLECLKNTSSVYVEDKCFYYDYLHGNGRNY
jgi:glycosyltransferase involved in cell wall biosynthesis